MRTLNVLLIAAAVVVFAMPVAAQSARPRLTIIPRASDAGMVYEVTGSGFVAGRAVRIDATNRDADQRLRFRVVPSTSNLGGVFLGRAEDGSSVDLAPGSWRVRARSGQLVAKGSFVVPAGGETTEWGGEHIFMCLSSKGAVIEYDCAHGTIDEALVLDSAWRFEARGVHYREHGGPIREDEPQDAHPALYTGTIVGKTMTLTVTLTDTNTELGTYTLELGVDARVLKCL